MKLFQRLSISCLILTLHSWLETVKSLPDENEVFSSDHDALKFNNLAIHEYFGTVFVGAINRLFKLSPNLTLLGNVTTTFEPDGMNYNKILVINYEDNLLIACGNSREYMCQTYDSINSDGKLHVSDKLKVDEMAEIGSNVSVVTLTANDKWRANSDGILKLYVAFSYGGYSTDFPALTIRSLKSERKFGIYREENTFISERFTTSFHDVYKVNYIYGFNSKQYNYFLTTQLHSAEQKSSYMSKIIRICFDGQSLWRGYSEIPIECKSEGENSYNLIQAATVGKPNAQLAISLKISTADDVLYAVFSKSRDRKGLSNEPSDRNALCIYSLKAINEKFVENIQNCFNGNGYQGLGNKLSYSKCNKKNDHIGSTFCSSPVNMPLSGNQPITASPVITFNTRLTAIVTKSSDNYNDVFIGTDTGHLKKIVVRDVYRVCEHAELQIDEGSPVNADLLFSPDNSHLYIMTGHKLTRIKTPTDYVDCSNYEGFNNCEAASKYCGWCALINKCTTRCDCFYRNYTSWKSKNFEEHARITEDSSYELQIGAAKEFLFSTNISFAQNTTFVCGYSIGYMPMIWSAFGNVHPKRSNIIICPAPPIDNFRDIEVRGNYLYTNLSITMTDNTKIIITNITFFDCGIYNSSEACIFSMFKCDWRPEENKCIHNATIIYIKTAPIENTSQIISIPSGMRSVLEFTNVSLRNCNDASNIECTINIEKNNYTKKAKIRNCNSISCEGSLFKYDKNSPYTLANVTIMQATSTFRDVLFQTNFVLYKCSLMAQNCPSCLGVNSEYKCGWCLSSKTCEFKSNCDGQILENPQTCPESPPSSITSVSPLLGPTGGGTNVTIKGQRLGYKFEDIRADITVAGIACIPFREKYKAMESITCAIEKVNVSENHSGPVEVSINGERIKSLQNFKFVVPKLENIFPKEGFTRGGTILTISGKNLNAGSSINVFIGSELCKMISCNSSNIQCITKGSSTVTEAKIYVNYDNNIYNLTGESFTYIKDPKRDENGYNNEPTGIPAGGIEMLIRNMTNFRAEGLLFYAYGKNQTYNSTCKIKTGSNSTWSCVSPHIPDIKSDSIDVNSPIEMNVSFKRNQANGETLVELENLPRKFFLFPNPEFHCFFDSSVEFNGNEFVIIEGKDIDKACQKTDIIVKVGSHTCEVISISSNQVVCNPSESSSPHEMDKPKLEHNFLANHDNVSISIGKMFTVVGRKQNSSGKSEPPYEKRFILYAVIIIIIIVLIAVIYVFISKKKLVAKTKKLKKTQQQMTRLELRVASECKEAFVELQTQATTFMVDESYTHLPFSSYHTYAMNILFPNKDDHPCILNGNAIPIHKEEGLLSFRELLMNKQFLLSFVRTLEKEESFTINDRVVVASMIMITLQKDMEYCTDILQTLLAELIGKYMRANIHPKLLFRKTESIAEKMLSAWFSFLLYEFLKESAGPPMFNLFTAIKEHVNRGPVDMVTSQARYCLSENKILRHKIEFSSMTIYVNIPLQTAKIIELEAPIEEVPVQVLDCDTISQFKEKALDAIHHTINYNRNLYSAELYVEWVYDTLTRKILSDDDSSSATDGEWRQKNTLRHYGVSDGSVLNLISDKETNFRPNVMSSFKNRESKNTIKRKTSTLSIRKSRKKSLTESITALIQSNDQRCKEWHLIKPHDSLDGQEDHSGINQMMPEIYLPRLLATKSSLQKFVDELFDVIFKKSNQNSCFIIAIKYMFDFLDDQAFQHNINDPEVVHVWKNNCLPLRFWVNLIKNPNFLFDVHKSNIVDSCLSVVAQVLMDSCSTSEQQLSKDSATTKLLYAKEIPIYNKLVKKYYADIENMPRISSQDMNDMLVEVSKNYATDFDMNMPVHELFKYAMKYKEKLIDALMNEKVSKDDLLVLKLEEVMEIMSSVSNY